MNRARIGIMFLVCIILVGCDRYYDVRPGYNVDEIWVSNDPKIYFVGWNDTEEKRMGVIKNGKQEIEMCIYFNYGSGIICERYHSEEPDEVPINDDVIFRGTCKFGKDKLTVKDIRFVDDIFDGSVDTITFEKRNYEEWLKETESEVVEVSKEES